MDLVTYTGWMTSQLLHSEVLRGELVAGSSMVLHGVLVQDAGLTPLLQALPMSSSS